MSSDNERDSDSSKEKHAREDEDEARKVKEDERMAHRAKYARTAAKNKERQRREDEKLAQETAELQGGRQAKRHANEYPVWKQGISSRKSNTTPGRTSSSSKGPTGRRNSYRDTVVQNHHDGNGHSKKGAQASQKHVESFDNKQQPKGERRGCSHLKSQQLNNNQGKHPKKRKRANSSCSRSADSASESSSNDGDFDLERSQSVGSSDDNEEEPDMELERPSFPGAKDLFNIDDADVEMRTRLRLSLRSATLPPLTDDDDLRHAPVSSPKGTQGSSAGSVTSHYSWRPAQIPADNNDERSLSASESLTYAHGACRRATSRSAAKAPVGKGRLEKKFNDKRPRVVEAEAPTKMKAKPSVDHDEEGKASPEVSIVHDGKTQKVKLLDQPITIQEVVRKAIDRATKDVILRKPWPKENNRPTYGRDLLLQACRAPDLMRTNDRNHLKELRTELMKNPSTAKFLGSLVTGRLSLVRASAKAEAMKTIPYYQLGLRSNCEDRVRLLMTDFMFHMPGTWGGARNNEWQPSQKEAFLSLPIIDTIRTAYFSTHTATGRRYERKFTSNIPSAPAEQELPISLLALGMTTVYCALYEFKSGCKEAADFDGNTFLTVNQDIVALLEKLRNDKPVEFHNRMNKLYHLVCDTSSSAPVLHAGAYTLIEF